MHKENFVSLLLYDITELGENEASKCMAQLQAT